MNQNNRFQMFFVLFYKGIINEAPSRITNSTWSVPKVFADKMASTQGFYVEYLDAAATLSAIT